MTDNDRTSPPIDTSLEVQKQHDDKVTNSQSAVVPAKRKRRAARVQVDPEEAKERDVPPQTGTVFNIWYHKWSGGDREDKFISNTKAEKRCVISRDAGYTKADKIPGSFFCVYFARGLCMNGKNCQFLHRLPTMMDIFNPNVDCFGRDKHADYRDDMGGIGSFMRQNRTIYVGRIAVSDDVEEIVARHFAEWGEVERIRVLNNRGVAFVTYVNEANAQFAREAMAHQSLDHDEVLNVRWATVDPNPAAQAREKRMVERQAAEAVKRLLPPEMVAEIEGRDPEAVKRRKKESNFSLPGYTAPDDVWFARGENAINPLGKAQTHAEALVAPSEKAIPLEDVQDDPGTESSSNLQSLANAAQVVTPKDSKTENGNALFSQSTLQALNKIKSNGSAIASVVKPRLVGYDDSDEE